MTRRETVEDYRRAYHTILEQENGPGYTPPSVLPEGRRWTKYVPLPEETRGPRGTRATGSKTGNGRRGTKSK